MDIKETPTSRRMNCSLGEADEVLMVGVHVSQLAVNMHHDLLLALLLLLPEIQAFCFSAFVDLCETNPKNSVVNLTFFVKVPDVSGDDSLGFLPKPWIACHLQGNTRVNSF